MKKIVNATIRPLVRSLGIDIVRFQKSESQSVVYPRDFTDENIKICEAVEPYTMTTPVRVKTLINAVHYIVANRIDGTMVECGVWKGGSMMAIALALKAYGDESRDLYLYDTFFGMSAPTDADVTIRGRMAHEQFSETRISEDSSNWCFSPLDEVRKNMLSTGYPKDKIHFVQGKVEDTLPEKAPSKIALLRLDTDWYESTKCELTHLFPLLQPNGVLILDDYGFWQGMRQAVDDYFSEHDICIFLNRIDTAARIAIKVG